MFAAACLYTLAASEPTLPHVVETTPTLNACFVPPGLAEIVVRFDRPMSQGSWSWCGGGDHYPETTGAPRFRDAFTAVLPVKLKPEWTYSLGVNCPSARNFRSAEGVSAEPFALAFTTGPGESFIMARADNHAAWLEFRRLFMEVYSYRDRLGIDWNQRFDDLEPCVLSAPSVEEFVLRIVKVLADAEDPHLAMRLPDDTRIRTHRRFAVYNGNEAAIERAFPELKKHNNLVWSSRRNDIGYLAIRGWNNEGGVMDVIQGILKEMQDTRCLILDVRGNGGGSEDEAIRVARWFVEKEAIYATHRYRDPKSPTGWGRMRQRWIQPNPEEQRYAGRVLVLQGPVCLSSNEAFLEMMKLCPRATSVGDTSGGSSANPRSFDLPNAAKVVLPRWESYSPDGVLLEGRGIEPDIRLTGDFTNADPVLQKALQMAEGGE